MVDLPVVVYRRPPPRDYQMQTPIWKRGVVGGGRSRTPRQSECVPALFWRGWSRGNFFRGGEEVVVRRVIGELRQRDCCSSWYLYAKSTAPCPWPNPSR